MVASGCVPREVGFGVPQAAWGLWDKLHPNLSSVTLSSVATFLTCANVKMVVIKLSPVNSITRDIRSSSCFSWVPLLEG